MPPCLQRAASAPPADVRRHGRAATRDRRHAVRVDDDRVEWQLSPRYEGRGDEEANARAGRGSHGRCRRCCNEREGEQHEAAPDDRRRRDGSRSKLCHSGHGGMARTTGCIVLRPRTRGRPSRACRAQHGRPEAMQTAGQPSARREDLSSASPRLTGWLALAPHRGRAGRRARGGAGQRLISQIRSASLLSFSRSGRVGVVGVDVVPDSAQVR